VKPTTTDAGQRESRPINDDCRTLYRSKRSPEQVNAAPGDRVFGDFNGVFS
jgi:hypothetical protein